jgi:hypothetical protein
MRDTRDSSGARSMRAEPLVRGGQWRTSRQVRTDALLAAFLLSLIVVVCGGVWLVMVVAIWKAVME